MSASANTMNGSQETVTLNIRESGIDITLPLKFSPGHVLNENEASVLNAAYTRQFTNNENAIAKAAIEKNKEPATAAELVAKWADYAPNVGRIRIDDMDKLREDAAWRMWSGMVSAHNKAVNSGHRPVIAKAGNKEVALVRGEARTSFINTLLRHDAYADRIQQSLDELLAERAANKGKAKADAVKDNSMLL